MPQQSFEMRLYRILVHVSTLIVCCLHIGIIARQYLLYETTTKLTIRYEDSIVVPVVVICMSSDWQGDNISHLFATQHAYNDHRLQRVLLDQTVCRPDLRALFNTRNSTPAIFNGPEIYNFLSIKMFARGRDRCFTYRMKQRRVDISRLTSTLTHYVYSFQLRFNVEELADFDYYLLHPDHIDPFVDSRIALSSHYTRSNATSIPSLPTACLNYQRLETRLLKSPYNTKCLNYSSIGLQSQLHCLNECLKRKSMQQLSLLPEDVSVFEPEGTIARLMGSNDLRNQRTRTTLAAIRRSCEQECKNKDCVHDTFNVYSDCYVLRLNSTRGGYYLMLPNMPAFLIETFVSFPFLEFVMMSLNIVSLWTAFSPIQLSTAHAFLLTKRCRIQARSCLKRKFRMFSDRSFRFVIIITCISSCLWQLQKSADEYFKYPTVSKVAIQLEDPVLIPAVTLCKSIPNEMSNKKTYASLFDALEDDKMTFIKYAGPIEKLIINNHYCVTLYPVAKTLRIANPRDDKLNSFVIRHLTRKIQSFTCLTHDSSTRVHGHYTSYSILRLIYQVEWVAVSYRKYRSELLPPPYDGMCRDYGPTVFLSQHHCIESCAISHSFSNNESYPSFMSAVYEPFNITYNPVSQPTRHQQLLTLCQSKCPHPDCQTNKYSPRTYSWTNFGKNVSADPDFLLKSANGPMFTTTSKLGH